MPEVRAGARSGGLREGPPRSRPRPPRPPRRRPRPPPPRARGQGRRWRTARSTATSAEVEAETTRWRIRTISPRRPRTSRSRSKSRTTRAKATARSAAVASGGTRIIPRGRQHPSFGAIAQLGERYNGIVEVGGSIPFGSTKIKGLARMGGPLFDLAARLPLLTASHLNASSVSTEPSLLIVRPAVDGIAWEPEAVAGAVGHQGITEPAHRDGDDGRQGPAMELAPLPSIVPVQHGTE